MARSLAILATAECQHTIDDRVKTHVLQCPDSPVTGLRPANMECAILVRKTFPRLPQGSVVWRLETFPSTEVPPAATYKLLDAEAYAGSDAMNLPHTH